MIDSTGGNIYEKVYTIKKGFLYNLMLIEYSIKHGESFGHSSMIYDLLSNEKYQDTCLLFLNTGVELTERLCILLPYYYKCLDEDEFNEWVRIKIMKEINHETKRQLQTIRGV